MHGFYMNILLQCTNDTNSIIFFFFFGKERRGLTELHFYTD